MSNLLKLSAVAALSFALHGSLASAAPMDKVQMACDKGEAQACQQISAEMKTPAQAEWGRWGRGPGFGRPWRGGGFCYWHPYAPACRF